MNAIRGQLALLTGASGGLGVYMARALADQGANLALVAYPGMGLDQLKQEVLSRGISAESYVVDLRDAVSSPGLIERIRNDLGEIDILVNNAGIEQTCLYHELDPRMIEQIVDLNLRAPMLLSRFLLPGMVRRGRGHIVNVSSLAGKSGPALQEPYAATKAGLLAFTASLRATYWGTGVSASAVCPGFVEAGIYARIKSQTGVAAPAILGTSPPEKVARALIRAIRRDLPEVIINPNPVRPLFALTACFPVIGEWLVRVIGAHDFFRQVASAQTRLTPAQSESSAPEPGAAGKQLKNAQKR